MENSKSILPEDERVGQYYDDDIYTCLDDFERIHNVYNTIDKIDLLCKYQEALNAAELQIVSLEKIINKLKCKL